MTDVATSDYRSIGGTTKLTGRSEDIWGVRRVGLYRVTLTSSAPAGGFTFDPQLLGFQGVVGAVLIRKHILVANMATLGPLQFEYDFVNKKIVPVDAANSYDDAAGDNLSTVTLDLIVIGE